MTRYDNRTPLKDIKIDLPDGWYHHQSNKALFLAVKNGQLVLWLQNMGSPGEMYVGKARPFPELCSRPEQSMDDTTPNANDYRSLGFTPPIYYRENLGIGSYVEPKDLKFYKSIGSSEPGWAPTLLGVAAVLGGLGLVQARKNAAAKPQIKVLQKSLEQPQQVSK